MMRTPFLQPPSLRRAAAWLGALWLALASGAAGAQLLEVRVGVYQNQPKIFMGDDGQPSGILGDLLVAIAKQEGWKLQSVRCEWQACLDALQAGKIDLMPDVAYTEQRAEIFDFHKVPSLLSWSQVYKHAGTPINSALDLKGKRLAVLEGSVQMDYLRNLLSGFGVHTELVQVSTLKDGFERASAGAVDAVAANRFYGDLQAPLYKLESTPIVFLPSQLFYASAKGRNSDLLSAIDRLLERWGADPDSQYFVILKRWMSVPPQFSVPAYLWWGLTALVLLLAMAVGAGVLLRRQVAQQTTIVKAGEERLATILNSVDAYIFIKDTELRYQYANRKVCELFGGTLEQIVGKTDAVFFDPSSVTRIQHNDRRVINQGDRVEEEEVTRSADGTVERTYLAVKLPLRDSSGNIYALCGISTDITKHKQAEEAIHQLAFYDPLTGLPNRRLLMERMQQAMQSHKRDKQCGALLFVDVDNFKDLNDTMGHHVGDELLRQMAKRLGTCTRAQDTLARQGGDEFVVMLEGLSVSMDEAAQQTRKVSQKILEHLHAPYQLEGQQYISSVSIGVAMFSAESTGQDDLLKQADLAMYQAKSAGRNAMRFFDPQMQAMVHDRTALEADLRSGIAAEEFLLHYQPQVDHNGRQFAAEALVRWQHPQRGLVSPGTFIPVAESSGLIIPLGEWILNAACRQLVTWSETRATAPWLISVNVSAKQFRQTDFVHTVQAALRATGANPERLELELTESLLVDDVESVITKMNALKALGVRFSLDDFGTGYSSLSMLKRLPLDQLKVDQSFVRDLLTDPQDASIVRAIVAMGASLELDVIAEGVETQAQRDALAGLGCRQFQGYLFGKPSPA
jgi:diguanylate cyclase (GGDEF)-like protein/PAS domain S-box-containing protein